MRLYHYCCKHAAEQIDRSGYLRPSPLPWSELERLLALTGWHISTGLAGAPTVVWLTDLAEPDADSLGLTSESLPCDRTEVRYDVDCAAIRWTTWALLSGASLAWRQALEEGGGKPDHWFVATERIPISARRVVRDAD